MAGAASSSRYCGGRSIDGAIARDVDGEREAREVTGDERGAGGEEEVLGAGEMEKGTGVLAPVPTSCTGPGGPSRYMYHSSILNVLIILTWASPVHATVQYVILGQKDAVSPNMHEKKKTNDWSSTPRVVALRSQKSVSLIVFHKQVR